MRSVLRRRVEGMRQFHTDFQKRYHPQTFAHFGAEHHKDLLAWGEMVWGVKGLTAAELAAASNVRDDYNGKLRIGRNGHIAIAKPDTPGDGTVPLASGAAPGDPGTGVIAVFQHGRAHPTDAPAKHNAAKGYDHQGSYNDKAGRSRFATFYGIVRAAQFADWHSR